MMRHQNEEFLVFTNRISTRILIQLNANTRRWSKADVYKYKERHWRETKLQNRDLVRSYFLSGFLHRQELSITTQPRLRRTKVSQIGRGPETPPQPTWLWFHSLFPKVPVGKRTKRSISVAIISEMLRKSFLFNQKQTHPKATELHLQKQSFYPGLFLLSPVKLLVELFWLSLRCFFQTSSLALGLILIRSHRVGDCFLFRLGRYFTSVRLCCPVGHVDTITWERSRVKNTGVPLE